MPDRVVSYNFRANFAQFTAGLAAMGKSVEATAGKLTALDKNGAKMRAGLAQVGAAGGKVGLVFAAGVGVAVAAAANFEQAMSNVKAATHETASNMALLRQAALDAGQATQYSATESAAAIEELAKAGVSTKDILAGGLTGALNLAAAGGLDVADAAETAASAMTQFSLGGQDVEHIADLLAAGAGKAQGSVSDLGMALNQSGLVAAQTGLSIEETVGTLAEFANAGLIGSDAGTSFKTMLQSLTPSSDKAADLMASLGLSAYDAQGNFVGMTEYAGRLKESLSDLSVEQQNAALKTIFGSDAVRAASIIFKDGAAGAAEWQSKVDDSGYAAETAATKMDNLKGDLEQLRGAFETALIGAGDGGQGPLRSLVQGATDVINVFNKLPSSAKSAATGLAAVTAVIGGGLWFTSKTVNGITAMRGALENLGVSATKSSKAMKGIGVAAGVAVGVESLFIALDQLNKKLDESLPGANALEGRLIDLANGAAPDLGGEFDSLSESIARVADGRWDDGLTSFFDAMLPGDTRAKSLREASAEIDALDQSLASLVQSGNADIAAKAIAALGLSGDQLKQLKNLLPGYNEALAGTSNDTKLAADVTTDFGTAQEAAKQQVQQMRDELRKEREDARGAAQGFVGLGDSLDDSKVSLSQWIEEMQKQAQALRDFTHNAQTAAKRGLDQGLIKSLKEAGPEGALRMKQLADATDSELKKANSAWRGGRAAIREYVKANTGAKPAKLDANDKPLNNKVSKALGSLRRFASGTGTATVDADNRPAMQAFNQTTTRLQDIDKFRATPSVSVSAGNSFSVIGSVKTALANVHNKTVTLTVITNRRGGVTSSAGGHSAGEPHAAGGFITGPGTGTSDSIPARLSNGEFVMRAAAVEKYGVGMMHAINTTNFAAGGLASRTYGRSQGDDSPDTKAGRAFRSVVIAATGSLKDLKAQAKSLEAQQKKLEKAQDKAQTRADDAQARYDSLKGGVSGGLTSDIFAASEASGSPWGAGATAGGVVDPIAALTKDIASSQEYSSLFAQLKARGLGAGALEATATQGLDALKLVANYSDAQLTQLGSLYDQRLTAVNSTAGTVADNFAGAELQAANKELAKVTNALHESNQRLNRIERAIKQKEHADDKSREKHSKQNAKDTGDKVNGAASNGHRRGK